MTCWMRHAVDAREATAAPDRRNVAESPTEG